MNETAAAANGAVPRSVSPIRRNFIWYFSQIVLRVFFAVWVRYRAQGAEKIPTVGGGLILSNHQSFIDPLMIGLPLNRPVSYLARDTLFKIPFLGGLMRRTYVMPINREGTGAGGIRDTVHRLDEGFLVGVFPEGTRSRDGSVGTLKSGFTAMLRRTSVPIFPVGIAGANHVLGRGSFFLKPCRVCVVYGDPITVEEQAEFRQKGRETELVARVRERIVACQQAAEAWLHR